MIRHWRIEMLGGLRVSLSQATAAPAGTAASSPPNSAAASQANATVSRFATAKCAALLAYLALHPRRAHSREELIALLWPDAEWEQGQTSLRSALAALRRQLEPAGTPPQSLLLANRQTLRLNPDAFSTDTADFESALKQRDYVRCHALYCGDLLPGIYQDWAIAERERFTALWEGLPTATATTAAPTSPPGSARDDSIAALSAASPLTPAGRLPLTLSRCFGREADISRLSELLLGTGKTPPRRLLTLTGPGGIGKTRLALEAARTRLSPGFGQAIFWSNLADLTDAKHIGARIVSEALALPPSADAEAAPLERAIEALASYPSALLVLDNLEQLLQTSEAAALIALLLRRVPHLSLLATSRRRLFVEGEWEYPVAPLALPDPTLFRESNEEGGAIPAETVEAAANSAAVQLFVDRAQAARPDFALTPRNAPLLVDLCRRLEGLPLALELVASRVQTMTPAQMRSGLVAERGLHQFVAARGHKEERHRSIDDAIAWSVRLLPPALQEFWMALSVFRGGFRAEAVRDVLQAENVEESLTQLRERSLLTLQETSGGDYLRFGFLETLREFAGNSLDDSTRQRLAAAHAAYFAQFAEAVLPGLMQKSIGRHLNDLEVDRSNFLAALDWCQSTNTEEAGQIGLRLGAALWRFWEMRGPIREGRAYLAIFLQKSSEPTEARANALNGAGMLAARQGDYDAARTYHEECLSAYRALQSRKGEAVALGNLGLLAAEQNQYDEARALYGESLRIRREIGDTFGVALMLNNLGNALSEVGDHALAQTYLAESLFLCREREDKTGIAQALGNLGNACYRSGNADEAMRLHEEGLAILTEINDKRGIACALLNLSEMSQGRNDTQQASQRLRAALPLLRELGDKRMMAYAMDSVAGLACAWGDYRPAALLYGAGTRLREIAGIHVPPVQEVAHEAALAAVRDAMGAAAYHAAFDEGSRLQEGAAKHALKVLEHDFTARD